MEFQSVMKKSLCVSLIIFSLTSLTFSQNIINDGGGDATQILPKLPHRPLLQQIGHVLDAAEAINSRNAFSIAQYLNEAENFVPLDVAQVQRILNAEDNAFRGVPNVPNTRVTITDALACLEIEMVRDAQINFIMEGTEVTAEAIDRYFIEKNLIVHWETALGSKRINAILGMSHDLSPAKQVKTVLATQIYLNKIQFAYPNNRALAIAIREVLLGVKFKFLSKADQNLSVENILQILDMKETLEREGGVISIKAISERVSKLRHSGAVGTSGSQPGDAGIKHTEFDMTGLEVTGDGESAMPMPTVGDVLRSKICQAGQRALKAIGLRRGEPAAVEDPWKGREKERAFLREHIVGRGIRR